ncbi:heavy metal-binding domain-containing protein [Flavobacterium wongokense]|uniref:heavy metal-binding domain-containing protein n=1 Tax=Flavobacterium wongokense TaxID=2910674 RepID=UPI001F1A8B06|nr:heavy metal-binding domain-containing protein [Flavobacterium sp. WG47]MCF6132767.1 hypothetical protein [Flavobacterium sp. WG47]
MKNLMFLSVILLVIVGCNSKTKTETTDNAPTLQTVDTTTADTAAIQKPVAEQLYACPMHPEVQGKKGEECSKCGMELTEPVK